MIEQFKKDVLEGLNKENKTLPSKYFYDSKGDKLFQQIMAMPEYYLTKSEMEIFDMKAPEIISSFEIDRTKKIELIELGAGDGTKTIKLLTQLIQENYQVEYIPIDISQNALDGLNQMLSVKLPELKVTPMQGTYFNVLNNLKDRDTPKIILFLGSNLGNLTDDEASDFLSKLGDVMQSKDKLLLGLDKIKSNEIVLPAYNDKTGITREFNLNLLDRINRDLNANFNRNQFEHLAYYEESEGIAKSYLVSKKEQKVEIGELNLNVMFKENERISTEISRKYSEEVLKDILLHTNFEINRILMDSKKYFMNVILSIA
jgi:dimethylhistidine N-methyltransferase